MLETEKEIQNLEIGYSALIVEVKHFWLKMSAKESDSLSSFKLSCRNMEHDVENKEAGGREDTIFQQISSPKFFQRLQEARSVR